MGEDGHEALEALVAELEALPQNDWGVWATDEWLSGSDLDLWAMSDQEIDTLAKTLEYEAEQSHVILDSSVKHYLLRLREEQQD